MANALYVLRHGETSWSRERRHTGRTDIPLTDAGRAQAVVAGQALRTLRADRPWSLVVISPLARAAETARLAGVEGSLDDRLREWDYGRYEGETTDAIRQDRPGWSLWQDGCPDGEVASDVATRVDSLLADPVRDALTGGDVLLVAHSHLLRVLAARWLGLGADAGRFFVLDPASVGILGSEHSGPAVLNWNLPSSR